MYFDLFDALRWVARLKGGISGKLEEKGEIKIENTSLTWLPTAVPYGFRIYTYSDFLLLVALLFFFFLVVNSFQRLVGLPFVSLSSATRNRFFF